MKHVIIIILIAGAFIFLSACKPDSPGFLSEYPGGVINLDLYYAISQNTNIIIAFDPDSNVNNGNEYLKIIPLGQYVQYDQNQSPFLYQSLTWYAPEVPEGEYYVYAWLDIDGEGDLDAATEEEYNLIVYSPNSDFYFNNQNYQIYSLQGRLLPNYEFWADYAPDITLDLTANMG